MSNDLVVQNDFATLQRMSKALYASGYFTDVKSEAQAIVKVMAGAELGIPPFAAMTGIHIIKGKPQLGANLIASMIKNDPRYDYRVTEINDSKCAITFFENGKAVGESAFSAADAKRAGTQNMPKFPRNMLFARAMSNGAKWFTPGVFGGMPVYVEGELGESTDVYDEPDFVEGEIVNVETPQTATEQPESDAPPILMSDKQRKKLHALGRDVYGPEWDAKRPSLVFSVTKKRATSSKGLTADEANALIEGMAEKLMERENSGETDVEWADGNPADFGDK